MSKKWTFSDVRQIFVSSSQAWVSVSPVPFSQNPQDSVIVERVLECVSFALPTRLWA